jgi:S-adenosylmethionine synthetase
MTQLRFAEAVCCGHPDKLADTIASRIVNLVCALDDRALVGVEVAIHRRVVFVDGQISAGEGPACAVTERDLDPVVRQVFGEAGYGQTPSGHFEPAPEDLEVRFDLCLTPLDNDERRIRDISGDQSISVGYAVEGNRAGYRPVAQALATDFARALECLRRTRPALGLGPDGKTLVAVRGRALAGVSISVHHRGGAEWIDLTQAVRAACEKVAAEYIDAGELEPLADVDWLINGAGAFELGGPFGDNGLSGKKLVADAYGSAVPIGGGAFCGKDPHSVDPRGQKLARQMALDLVVSGSAREATVWVVWRPGDEEPRWIETRLV